MFTTEQVQAAIRVMDDDERRKYEEIARRRNKPLCYVVKELCLLVAEEMARKEREEMETNQDSRPKLALVK